ncbi:hypothetical protein [Mesorhizobium sanjuanii]|uniref:hypothetical protein n=1 Tax=Mesorhizobium sanjuanii TaxID=2037900 RepID=UPI001FE1F5F5|nr:hypothetical protein [Mesorhizobium sanjuanii]
MIAQCVRFISHLPMSSSKARASKSAALKDDKRAIFAAAAHAQRAVDYLLRFSASEAAAA